MNESNLNCDDLKKILEINKRVLSTYQLERFFNQLVDEAIGLIGAERGFLILFQDGGSLVKTARNLQREDLKKSAQKFSTTIVGQTSSKGSIILTTDAGADPKLISSKSVHGMKLKSVICAPLALGPEILGVLYLDNRVTRGAFGERETELIELLADQAVLALKNTELLDENKANQRELKRQNQTIEKLNTDLKKQMKAQERELKNVKNYLDEENLGKRKKYKYENIVGESPLMKDVFRIMDRVMDSDVPVYILGEPGTGKKLIAQALHYNGSRKEKAFVSEKCSAFSGDLLARELFGYKQGTFDGAEFDKEGLLSKAHGGTLFLDDISEMDIEVQAQLLQVLQKKEFKPFGSDEALPLDIRLVTASSKELSDLTKLASFRKDLYFAINVVRVNLPKLKDRREDVPALVRYFMKNNRLGVPEAMLFIDEEAMNVFIDYDWPGNIQELENEINRTLILGKGQISLNVVSHTIRERSNPMGDSPEEWNLNRKVSNLERVMIERALNHTRGNKVEAANLLGISRGNFYQKLQQYGLEAKNLKLTPQMIKEAIDECGGNKAMAARRLGIGRKTLYNYLEKIQLGS